MAGGIDGEGSHHIERGNNKSQWVYVTSSVVDLDLLVGNRVIVWGETNLGKKSRLAYGCWQAQGGRAERGTCRRERS
jgi:hypothetical protein